jgi:mannosyltransferase OCH1-like enzyme
MIMVIRYLAARVAKLIGNLLKVLCYPLHFLFPRVRFSLPHRAEPIFATNSTHRIPKIIWQTNYTDQVTLAVYINYLFNRCLSPTYAYCFMDTRERAEFIKQHCSAHAFESYSRLLIGAAQADLWRILVLQKFGARRAVDESGATQSHSFKGARLAGLRSRPPRLPIIGAR